MCARTNNVLTHARDKSYRSDQSGGGRSSDTTTEGDRPCTRRLSRRTNSVCFGLRCLKSLSFRLNVFIKSNVECRPTRWSFESLPRRAATFPSKVSTINPPCRRVSLSFRTFRSFSKFPQRGVPSRPPSFTPPHYRPFVFILPHDPRFTSIYIYIFHTCTFRRRSFSRF